MCRRQGLSLLALIWQAVAASADGLESAASSLHSTGFSDTKALAANFNNGTLYSGSSLTEGQKLFSLDGSTYLVIQTDCNLVLYNVASGDGLFSSGTYGNGRGCYLTMQDDCNLVLFNATGSPLFSSNTGPNSGLNPPSQPPCHLTVSGAGGGQITIIDSYMHGQLSDTVVYTRPKVGNAQLVSGQELDQNVRLYSVDDAVFINLQADGNLVLYNETLKAEFGASPATAIWDTNTAGVGGSNGAPYVLAMQTDCNLVIYALGFGLGRVAQAAIYSSGTYFGQPPCVLTVESANGGSVDINDRTGALVFNQPAGHLPASPPPPPCPPPPPPPVTLPPPVSTLGGMLASGQTWPQEDFLYSADGTVFLNAQADGNLVLYHSAGIIPQFQTATFGAANGPFKLTMQTDCDLVLTNSLDQTIYHTGTAGQGMGCTLTVSGNGGGELYVRTGAGALVFIAPNRPSTTPAPTSMAPPTMYSGTLVAPGDLAQDTRLYSPDGLVYLLAQSDGNLVLYQSQGGYLYASGTFGVANPPFTLSMQADCNLVLYSGSQRGASSAVFSSGTYGAGTGCSLVVSSANGGYFAIINSAGIKVFHKP